MPACTHFSPYSSRYKKARSIGILSPLFNLFILYFCLFLFSSPPFSNLFQLILFIFSCLCFLLFFPDTRGKYSHKCMQTDRHTFDPSKVHIVKPTAPSLRLFQKPLVEGCSGILMDYLVILVVVWHDLSTLNREKNTHENLDNLLCTLFCKASDSYTPWTVQTTPNEKLVTLCCAASRNSHYGGLVC